VVEHPPGKCEALSSNPSTTKKEKENRGGREGRKKEKRKEGRGKDK
jgi:hypothetical protein